jgi:hypothetical protein
MNLACTPRKLLVKQAPKLKRSLIARHGLRMQHHGSAPLVIEHPLRHDSDLLLVLAKKLTPDAHSVLSASLPSNYDVLPE